MADCKMPDFDKLLKYDGEAFKVAVVGVLKVLYSLQVGAQESHNEDIKRMTEAVKLMRQSAEKALSAHKDFEKRLSALTKIVRRDETVH